ncbi:MAG: hypothetical protein EI684_18830 [Candidatus Viridilinea halotolerans]|uniref:Actin-binding WH2 domain-containing protein n=1 Tax=Candidatus Viridilinea halotolerans TaxID=2491704 RepID=A0A426TT46_9CHLR|nr:MAG: hypothetical protein EI684_18830 [Candidatus Viridilinea halotolerans]
MTAVESYPRRSAPQLLIIERILRDRDSFWYQVAEERDLNSLIGQMVVSSGVSFALYGLVLGLSHSWMQALSSAVKLPLLFILTIAICLPSLYLFNLVFGSRLSVRQALSVVMTSVTVIAMLTLAFAPISLFFLLSAPNYEFFKLLNVGILTITGFVGLTFLIDGMRYLNNTALQVLQAQAAQDEAISVAPARTTPQDVELIQPISMKLLYFWIVLFGFVGTQLAWTLRPFFGDPGGAFALFRQIEGNFYTNLINSVLQMLR